MEAKLNRTPFGRVDPNIIDKVDHQQNVVVNRPRRRPRRPTTTTTGDGAVVGVKKKWNILDVDDSEYDFLEKEFSKKTVKVPPPPQRKETTVIEFDSKRKTPKISNCVVVQHHDAAAVKIKKKNYNITDNNPAENTSASSVSSLSSSFTSTKSNTTKISSNDRRIKENEQLIRRKRYWKKRLHLENEKQRKKGMKTKNNNIVTSNTNIIETKKKKKDESESTTALSVKDNSDAFESNQNKAVENEELPPVHDDGVVGFIGKDQAPIRSFPNNQTTESNNIAAEYTTPMLLSTSQQNKIVYQASKKPRLNNNTPYSSKHILHDTIHDNVYRQEKNGTEECIQKNETKVINTNSSHKQESDQSENQRLSQRKSSTENTECEDTIDDDDDKSETTYESNTIETNSNVSDDIEDDLQCAKSSIDNEDCDDDIKANATETNLKDYNTSSVKSSSPEDSVILDRDNTPEGEDHHGINFHDQNRPFSAHHNDELPEIWSWEHAIQLGGNNQASELIREPVFTIDGQLFKHPPMPPGWKLKISESRNRPYYMHPDFGVTWHAPVALPSMGNAQRRPRRFDRNAHQSTVHGTPPSSIHIDSDVPNTDVLLANRKREGISSVDLLTTSETLSCSIKKRRSSPIDPTQCNESHQTPMSSSNLYSESSNLNDQDDRMNQSDACASTATKKSNILIKTPSIHLNLSTKSNEDYDEHLTFQSNLGVNTTTKKRSSMKTPCYETQHVYDETITMSERSTSIITHHLRQRRQALFIDTPIEQRLRNQYLPHASDSSIAQDPLYEQKLVSEIGILPNHSAASPLPQSLPDEISFHQKNFPAETHSTANTSIPGNDSNDSAKFEDNIHVTSVEYDIAQTPANFSPEDISRPEQDSHISEQESDIFFSRQRSVTTPKMFATNKIIFEKNNNLSTSSDATPQTSRDFSPDDIPCSGHDKQNQEQDSDISFFQPSSIKTPKTFGMNSSSPGNCNNLPTSSDDDINVTSEDVCIDEIEYSEQDMQTSSQDSNIKFFKPAPISTPNVLCASNRIITDPNKMRGAQYTKSGHRIRVGYETIRALEPTMPLCQLQVIYLLPRLRAAERRRQKRRVSRASEVEEN